MTTGYRNVVIAFGFAVTACDAGNLLIAHRSVIGIDAAVNSETTSGQLVIGYDRNFITSVPKSVPIDTSENEEEAMAVLSCSELEIEGIYLSKFTEYLATGKAARNYSNNKSNEVEIFDCFNTEQMGDE